MDLRGSYLSHCIPQLCHAFFKVRDVGNPCVKLILRRSRHRRRRHHHHHHHRLYSPGWALASSSTCRQWPLPWSAASQFLQPIFLTCSSAPSIHLDFGRTRPRWPPRFVRNIFFGASFSSMRTACPAHLDLLDLITLTVLVQGKALLILYCISSATALPRILDHTLCEGFSFPRYSVFFHHFLS